MSRSRQERRAAARRNGHRTGIYQWLLDETADLDLSYLYRDAPLGRVLPDGVLEQLGRSA